MSPWEALFSTGSLLSKVSLLPKFVCVLNGVPSIVSLPKIIIEQSLSLIGVRKTEDTLHVCMYYYVCMYVLRSCCQEF